MTRHGSRTARNRQSPRAVGPVPGLLPVAGPSRARHRRRCRAAADRPCASLGHNSRLAQINRSISAWEVRPVLFMSAQHVEVMNELLEKADDVRAACQALPTARTMSYRLQRRAGRSRGLLDRDRMREESLLPRSGASRGRDLRRRLDTNGLKPAPRTARASRSTRRWRSKGMRPCCRRSGQSWSSAGGSQLWTSRSRRCELRARRRTRNSPRRFASCRWRFGRPHSFGDLTHEASHGAQPAQASPAHRLPDHLIT
jgi:hypothetical protein